MKVLMAGPYDSKGRYKGGIASIINGINKDSEIFSKANLQLVEFNTCRIERSNTKDASFSLKNFQNFIRTRKEIIDEIRNCKAAILYYHTSIGFALLKDLLVIAHAKRKNNVKTIVHIHAADFEHVMTGISKVDKLIFSLLDNVADRVVFLSNRTQQDFVKRGLLEEKTFLIYNYASFCFEKSLVENQIVNKETNFLFVGTIEPMKGIFDFLEALLRVPEKWVFHVCGAFADEEDRVKFTEYQNKIGNKLIFHGFITGENKSELFLNADVVVLPSYAEGMPVVLLEAYQAGCAVVSTNVGAIPEIVAEKNGWLIKPGDIDDLERVLKTIINDSDRIKYMKANNYSESAQYSLEEFEKKILNVCLDVMMRR